MTLLGTLLLFGASQGLLLAVVILCIKTGDRAANVMLGLFLGISALEMGLLALSYSGLAFDPLIYQLYALAILKGPALYLYVRALTAPGTPLGPSQLKHLLWIVPNLLLMWFFTFSRPVEPVRGEVLLDPGRIYWYLTVLNMVSLAYAVASLALLNRHRERVENLFSSIEEVSLGWLKWLLVFYIAFRIGNFGLDLLTALDLFPVIYKSYAVALLNLGVIYFVSFGGLRQPIVFSHQLRSAAPEVLALVEPVEASPGAAVAPGALSPGQDAAGAGKYGKSGLSEARAEVIWERLSGVMAGERPYLSADLTLPGLAELMDLSANDLSQVINSRAGGSFYEFVNGHRVAAAGELLSDPANDRRKLLDIAMDVGFKSQSTFYNHFRKHQGMTPSQFRAQR